MANLKVTLNQDYKSFKNGFTQELKGDLAILSGINGSGKSQLLDIIYGQASSNSAQKISAEIILGEQRITRKDIIYRSFKENVSIPELTDASTQSKLNSKNQAWSAYQQYRLNSDDERGVNHTKSCKELREALIQKYGIEMFNGGQIPQQGFFAAIPKYFIWRSDDLFTNFIGDIFFNYAAKVYHAHAQANKSGAPFDDQELGAAPWTELNTLFEKLRLEYRFKSNYEIVNDFEINEQPRLYSLRQDGALDENSGRQLSELSDGEKAIISLTFASLSGGHKEDRKVLLLDEYDATLNPSLVEAFYSVLENYFINEGIFVIIATHSAVTTSMAPDYANFYEVYKPKEQRARILEVNREDYGEIKKATEVFYNLIANQDERRKQVEEERQEVKEEIIELTSSIDNTKRLQIFTEGKNTQHIQKALELLAPELLNQISLIETSADKRSNNQLKNTFEVMCSATTIDLLFVWDCDSASMVRGLTETAHCYKYVFDQNQANTLITRGIENLYSQNLFTDELFDIETKSIGQGIQTNKILSKDRFLAKVVSLNDVTQFLNYESLITKIRTILDS